MPKVYNKRRPCEIPEDAVYVGRPSPWKWRTHKEEQHVKTSGVRLESHVR